MNKRILIAAAVAAALSVGVAFAQYPILDRIAEKVITKYQSSTCEQLWEARGKPKSEEEQKVVGFLRSDPQMRTYFMNKIAGPIANKMFGRSSLDDADCAKVGVASIPSRRQTALMSRQRSIERSLWE